MRNITYLLLTKLFGMVSFLMNRAAPNQRKVNGKWIKAKWTGRKFVWVPRGK